MNLKWLRQNLALVVGATVFVLLLAGVLWKSHQTSARHQQVQQELETERKRIAAARSSRPFPSRENLEAVRRDKDALRQSYKKLLTTLGRAPLEQSALEPVAFSQLLAQKLGGLRKQALVDGVTVSENFAFGFSRYVGTLPCHQIKNMDERRQIMRLLGQQLRVIESLSSLLMSNRVSELRSIRRVEVEPGAASADALSSPLTKDARGLYDIMPFEIQFASGAESLRQVLNALTEAPTLFIVRRLAVNVEDAAGVSGAAAPTGAAAGAETAKRTQLAVTLAVDFAELARPEGGRPPAGE